MGGLEKLAELCLLWIPKFVLSGSCLDNPLCLLAFSLFRQAHQGGQELNGWHGELLKRGLWDQLGRKGLHGCGWGNLVLLVLCFICNGKGTLGSKGLLDLLLLVICSAMKLVLVRHYLVPSCLGCLNKPSVLAGSPLLAKPLRL